MKFFKEETCINILKDAEDLSYCEYCESDEETAAKYAYDCLVAPFPRTPLGYFHDECFELEEHCNLWLTI
jgi:hypothetical protein